MRILAIQPWIYDFAAHDFWLQPYGFYVMLTYLMNQGCEVDFVDCLKPTLKQDEFGKGKYPAEEIEKPEILKKIPRYYKRYGITKDEFEKQIQNKNPDYILITSSMTYWYPAVVEACQRVKKYYPGVPVIVGGTYASLCYEHAQKTLPCDKIYRNHELKKFFEDLGIPYKEEDYLKTLPRYEDFDYNRKYAVLRTSYGCPFNCVYCSIKKSFPGFFRLPPEKVMEFITHYYNTGIKNFVFYDDAFLYENESVKQFLRPVAARGWDIRFHTPNAIHLRYLDEETAHLLKQTNFIHPHFGLETMDSDLQKDWGGKVSRKDLESAIRLLKNAGYKDGEFCVYLLFGYPGQDLEELKSDVTHLNDLGVRVSLSEFSPVPGTAIFNSFANELMDPLVHNNSIFGFFSPHDMMHLWTIKNEIKEMQRARFGTINSDIHKAS